MSDYITDAERARDVVAASHVDDLRRQIKDQGRELTAMASELNSVKVQAQAYKRRAEVAEAKLELAEQHIGKLMVDVLQKALAAAGLSETSE